MLYNNAGIMMAEDRSVVDTEEWVWDKTLAVNVKGIYLCCKYAIPEMVRHGNGSVINIERDWRSPGPKSEFLRALAKQACARFDVVLGPDHDRDHRDHLHLDLSGKKYCG